METAGPTGDGGATASECAAGGGGVDDGKAGTQDAYYDPNAAAAYDSYDADAAYYQYGSGGYDENGAYYDYYASAQAGDAAYYADGTAAGEYPQDYNSQDYYAYDQAGGNYNGVEWQTAAALPEALWYQEESTLDEGEGLADEISELQLAHSMGEYGGPASSTQWGPDAIGESAPQSNDTDVGSYDTSSEGVEADRPVGIDSPNQVDGASSTPAKAFGDNQQQQDQQETKKVRTASPKQKKTRQQRIQKRQELLEKQEENKTNTGAANKPMTNAKGSKGALVRKSSFVAREKAKMQLKMRIARAIARKRMPLQVRILTETRKHSSPLEKYFGGPVESVMSDIFWAAIKGDVGRVKFLVEVEGVNPADGTLDPWNLRQTPLHWAAKGGSAAVMEFLLRAGANPLSLDENGSLPLHLACWAGHVDATLALLRASSVKDLYLSDYDAGLAPLDWASIRGHADLIKAIEKYEDTLWLPKFVDDLIRGIVKYKIKLFREPPKSKGKAATAASAPNDAVANEANGATAAASASAAASPEATAAKEAKTAGSKVSASKQKTAKS